MLPFKLDGVEGRRREEGKDVSALSPLREFVGHDGGPRVDHGFKGHGWTSSTRLNRTPRTLGKNTQNPSDAVTTILSSDTVVGLDIVFKLLSNFYHTTYYQQPGEPCYLHPANCTCTLSSKKRESVTYAHRSSQPLRLFLHVARTATTSAFRNICPPISFVAGYCTLCQRLTPPLHFQTLSTVRYHQPPRT
jgi:hypothetical protein